MSTRKNFDLEKFPENRVSQRMISRVSPIYERSYVAKWLYEVMGQEVDDAEIRFSELREQANPETATWALRYWEQRYGIEVDESGAWQPAGGHNRPPRRPCSDEPGTFQKDS